MKNFAARTNGINMKIDGGMTSANRATLKPGVLMIMNTTDGELELLTATVTIANKHLVYFCNSWADSVSANGNDMISAIPLTKQFEFDIELENADTDAVLAVGNLVGHASGKYILADAGKYAIGSVKAGSTTATGGTITITTIGADYVVS